MAFHPLIANLPKAGRCIAHEGSYGAGASLQFLDDATESFSDFLNIFLPAGTPFMLAQVIAEAINTALDAAPPENAS
jgi:hypothetical protein